MVSVNTLTMTAATRNILVYKLIVDVARALTLSSAKWKSNCKFQIDV